MWKLKIDIVGKNLLTLTVDGTERFQDKDAARRAAEKARRWLFEEYHDGRIHDYTVDIVPANDSH